MRLPRPPDVGSPLALRHLVFRTRSENLHKCISRKSLSAKEVDCKNWHFLSFFCIFSQKFAKIWMKLKIFLEVDGQNLVCINIVGEFCRLVLWLKDAR